jgi:hypothetical protein
MNQVSSMPTQKFCDIDDPQLYATAAQTDAGAELQYCASAHQVFYYIS